MSKELDYLPWNTLLVSRINFYLEMFETSKLYTELKAYLASLVTPYYNKLGWIENVEKDEFVDR